MLSPEAARHLTVLDDLLVDCFSSAELVRLVEQTFGIAATGDLPVSAESSRLFMFHAVRALLRRGLLGTHFFAVLAQERPQRGAEIRRLAAALTSRADIDPSERQTQVWRGGSGERSRLDLVCALEQNLLARDRLAPGDATAVEIERAIDGLARRLRGAPMLTPGSVLATTRLEQVLRGVRLEAQVRGRGPHATIRGFTGPSRQVDRERLAVLDNREVNEEEAARLLRAALERRSRSVERVSHRAGRPRGGGERRSCARWRHGRKTLRGRGTNFGDELRRRLRGALHAPRCDHDCRQGDHGSPDESDARTPGSVRHRRPRWRRFGQRHHQRGLGAGLPEPGARSTP